MWDTKTWKFVKRLNFHFKGIQKMRFSVDSKYLISIGSKDEKSICVWNMSNYTVVDSKVSKFPLVDVCTEKQLPIDKTLNFVTYHYEVLSFWRVDSNYMIEGFHIKFEDLLRERDKSEYFTSIELTPYIDKNRASYVLMGTNLGSLLVVDKERRLLMKKYIIIANPITSIYFTADKLILLGESQAIVSWNIPKNDLFEMSFDFIEKEKSKILFVDNYATSSNFVHPGNEVSYCDK